MNHKQLLKDIHACDEAQTWYNGQDSETAWAVCERGDWMLWIAGKLDVDRKLLVMAACDCAELALPYAGKHHEAVQNCIAVTRRWCDGQATIAEV